MKPQLIIIPVITVSAAIGWHQHSTLSGLRKQNVELEQADKVREATSGRRERPSSPSASELAGMQALALRMAAFTPDSAGSLEQGESAKLLREQLLRLDHSTLLRLIGNSIEEKDGAERSRIIEIYVNTLLSVDAVKALQVLLELPAGDLNPMALAVGCKRALPKDPALVVRCFEKLYEAGDPALIREETAHAFFAAQSRIDPEIAVSRLLAPEGSRLAGDKRRLMQAIAHELREPQEHGAFLAALRNRGNSYSDSELRPAYLGALGDSMKGWPCDDATSLMDAECSPAEKLRIMYSIGMQLSMEEAPRWADWISGMQMPDKRDHIIGSFIGNWAASDPAGAKQWLEKAPEGAARDSAVFGYVSRVAPTRPEEAGETAMILPKTEARRRSLSVTAKYWKQKDAAAFEAFRLKNGLGPL